MGKISLDKAKNALYHRFGGYGLLRVGGAMAGTRGVTILTGMALSVLLARSLGAEGYGRYLFALTIAQMLAMPVLAGLPTLLTRQAAIYRGQADWSGLRGIIRWSLGFVGLSTGLVALVGVGYLAFSGHPPSDAGMVYMLALPLVVALAFMHVARAVLSGFEYPFWANLPDGLIRPVLLLGFVWGAVTLGVLTPALAMILHVSATLFALAWAAWIGRRHCPTTPPGTAPITPRFETRAWLDSLLPLSLITAAAMINSRLDIFMLGILMTEESVAVYGLAFQVAGIILIGQTITYNIVGPRVARMWAAGERDELRGLISTASRLSFFIASACVTGLAILGPMAVTSLVGDEFHDTVELALIISLGMLFSSAMGPAAVALNMIGYERIVGKATAVMALTNAILNLMLIPTYGAKGAAFASVGSMLVYHTTCVMTACRVLGLNTTVFQQIPRYRR
jgi:O-antigen/teichoic acid export membrane protein